jgi:hypothetical protein
MLAYTWIWTKYDMVALSLVPNKGTARMRVMSCLPDLRIHGTGATIDDHDDQPEGRRLIDSVRTSIRPRQMPM